MNHQTELKYDGELVDDIGNLRYDALQKFMTDLSHKLRIDSTADRTRGRPQLSNLLDKAADKLLESAAAISLAWMLCKPHMENADGCGCSGRPDEII